MTASPEFTVPSLFKSASVSDAVSPVIIDFNRIRSVMTFLFPVLNFTADSAADTLLKKSDAVITVTAASRGICLNIMLSSP